MNEFALAFVDIPDLEPWVLSDETQKLYRKELIYTGDFVKKSGSREQRFSVDERKLAHWKNTFDEMMHDGIEVPIPVEHTNDPEKRRGTVVGMEIGRNRRGLPALYMLSRFRDSDAERLTKTANVSLFQPPEWTSGTNKKYSEPIRHVALTDYPVIPALEGWEVIAASFSGDKTSQGEEGMTTLQLAQALGLQAADDATAEQVIMTTFKQLQAKAAPKPPAPPAAPPAPVAAPAPMAPPRPMPVAAAHKQLLRENRSNKLLRLASEGRITPAVQKDIEEMFCSDDELTLALSATGDGEEVYDDKFDKMVVALSKNEPSINFKEKSRGQTSRLPAEVKDEDNALVKGAKRRAEKALSQKV